MPTESLPLEPGAPAFWVLARERVLAYFEAAGLDEPAAASLTQRVLAEAGASQAGGSAEDAALVALRLAKRALAGHAGLAEAPTTPSLRSIAPAVQPLAMPRRSFRSVMDWRLATARLRRLLPAKAPRGFRRYGNPRLEAPTRVSGQAKRRRLGFTVLILLTTIWVTASFVQILGVDGLSPLDLAHTAVFVILLVWLAQSFWTLTAGAAVLAMRLLRHWNPITSPSDETAAPPPRAAIVVPIYNEDTHRVFAGLQAIWTELAAEAEASRCDLFILSDTTDPDIWLAELDAWQAFLQATPGAERVFYRRRLRNVQRKSGNIEDFVTRWGGAYGYMVVLDADSLMTGQAIAELVRRMDVNPAVGLIQAPPKLVRGHSLFARLLQFSGELYGPLSATGISYWALGEGNYWGHNAIIRVAPFAELCSLPLLPGRAPLGGEIMSHDFVEAALLRRGGWQVWIADDVPGSYEEPPPTVADFATRDRRWCQGNLQHMKVLFTRNLHWVSRLHLGIGIMSYLTSPLWLIFLLLSAAQAWELTYTRPVYFTEGLPFPMLPVSVEAEATFLLVVTLGLLFVPKLWGLILGLASRRRRRALGGGARLTLSAVIETVLSALVAPVMMVMHTTFVFQILLGAAIDWTPQRRNAGSSALLETARRFGWVTVLGIAASFATWWATPTLFFWLTPVLAGLVFAIPLSLLLGSEWVGQKLRQWRLLLIVEESEPPAVMQALDAELAKPEEEVDRFAEVVLDPGFNALHIAMLRAAGEIPTVPAAALKPLERKAVYLGPAALDKKERRALLEHPASMARLHLAAWLHWRSERPLAWERDEPLPPPPAAPRGQKDEVRSAA
jgi:membrane glycosyltransferase